MGSMPVGILPPFGLLTTNAAYSELPCRC